MSGPAAATSAMSGSADAASAVSGFAGAASPVSGSADAATISTPLIERARELAAHAHDGQTDKTGEPYIGHPRRVAEGTLARVRAASLPLPAPLAEYAVTVAWLHDVVEDTPVTLADLERWFPGQVVDAVDAISKREGEPLEAYLARVLANPLATIVKHADLADNSRPERLARLDAPTRERLTRKYDRTRELLAGE